MMDAHPSMAFRGAAPQRRKLGGASHCRGRIGGRSLGISIESKEHAAQARGVTPPSSSGGSTLHQPTTVRPRHGSETSETKQVSSETWNRDQGLIICGGRTRPIMASAESQVGRWGRLGLPDQVRARLQQRAFGSASRPSSSRSLQSLPHVEFQRQRPPTRGPNGTPMR
jgi:hypothetical protein